MDCQLTLRYSTLSSIADCGLSSSMPAESQVFASFSRPLLSFRSQAAAFREKKTKSAITQAGHGFSCSVWPQMGFMSRFNSRRLRHWGECYGLRMLSSKLLSELLRNVWAEPFHGHMCLSPTMLLRSAFLWLSVRFDCQTFAESQLTRRRVWTWNLERFRRTA